MANDARANNARAISTRRHEARRVLITGAGAGMGRATALRFAHEGASGLALVDRVGERLETLRREVASIGVKSTSIIVCELADLEAARGCVQAAIRDLGGLDVVVSNAGASALVPFIDTSVETMRTILAVNFEAAFVIGQEAARHMIQNGGGVILYTAATCDKGGIPEVPVYSASKAALVNLVRAIAPVLGPQGVRVNAVSPGFTRTNMSADMPTLPPGFAERLDKRVSAQLPLRRQADPDDIAAAFAFLASDDAAYITGIDLVVDGGMTAPAHNIQWT